MVDAGSRADNIATPVAFLCQWQGEGRSQCIWYVVHTDFESVEREIPYRDSNKAMFVYSVINLLTIPFKFAGQ